jgi:hypothetical protein
VPGADNKQKLGELPTDTLKIQDLQAGSLDFIEKKGKPTLRDIRQDENQIKAMSF